MISLLVIDAGLFGTFQKPTCKHEIKCFIPSKSKNRSQLMGVSSVTFHMVAHATSITSSNVFLLILLLIKLIIRCK